MVETEQTRPEDAEAKKAVISSGNPELDNKLGGGIPVQSLLLVEGQSDSGKSVLFQQLSWGSLRDGLRVCLLTTEDTVQGFVRQMESLNLDILDYLLLNRLKVYPVKAMKAKDGVEKALEALLVALRKQQGQDLVLVDSVTSFIAHSSLHQVIAFFEECKSLVRQGMTLGLTAHSYAFSNEILVRINSLCDAHLRMSIETLAGRLMKVLEVAKIKGAQQTTGNITSFDVVPGMGMKVVPYTKAKA
jgi:flagellar protein FlaH